MVNCRKFSIYRLLDELVWLLVAFGPFIYYAIYLRNFIPSEEYLSPMDIQVFFEEYFFLTISTRSSIYSAFSRMFQDIYDFLGLYYGIYPLAYFFVHFFAVQFIHVMFDLLCFIPKWCHEMMHKFVYKGGYDE